MVSATRFVFAADEPVPRPEMQKMVLLLFFKAMGLTKDYGRGVAQMIPIFVQVAMGNLRFEETCGLAVKTQRTSFN
jgi:hypothetical protein